MNECNAKSRAKERALSVVAPAYEDTVLRHVESRSELGAEGRRPAVDSVLPLRLARRICDAEKSAERLMFPTSRSLELDLDI